jgi:hypothetical protein
MNRRIRRERGATLLITLIMLIMLTLFAISAMNTSTDNLKMVGNMQERAEAFEASQAAIEIAISSPQFTRTPGNAVPNPCGFANTTCTDLNGDGIQDLQSSLLPQPRCVQARAIKTAELQIVGPTSQDLACTKAQEQGTQGVEGRTEQGDSECANTVWDITAQTIRASTTAATSDVNTTITQGIGVRIARQDMAANCP